VRYGVVCAVGHTKMVLLDTGAAIADVAPCKRAGRDRPFGRDAASYAMQVSSPQDTKRGQMGNPGFDLDALARSLARRGGTRRTLIRALGGAGAFAPLLALDADAKRKRKKKKKKDKDRCKFSPTCDGECCHPDRCFGKVGVSVGVPDQFACCPERLLSINSNSTGLPDQCCYEDETPKPELATNDNAQMLCCRPCPNSGDCAEGWADGCIIQPQYECIDGRCELVETARLPRVRR